MLGFLMFAFGGIELIGMAAAEANDQRKPFLKQLIKLLCVFWFSMLAHSDSPFFVPWNQLDLGGLDKVHL